MTLEEAKQIVHSRWPKAFAICRGTGWCVTNPHEFALAIGDTELTAWQKAAESAQFLNDSKIKGLKADVIILDDVPTRTSE